MPPPERDHPGGGRNSRASNMSNGSRGPTRPSPAMTKADQLANAPGVMSMLKSSTELGTESLIMPGPRFTAQNRPQNRHSGATSRMSTGSGRSQSSKRTSTHRAWPSVSSNSRRRSIASNFSNLAVPHYLDTLPPSLANLSDPATMPPPAPYFRDSGRSLSLTNSSTPPMALTNYRSLTSLRGHEPYQRPRSPYRYPTRLKRPGYRPSSPALSDVTGLPPSKAQHTRLGSGLRMAHGSHALGPHAIQGSYGSHGPHGSHLLHGLPMPPMARPGPTYSGLRKRSTHSVASLGAMDHISGTFPPSLPGSRQGTPSVQDQSVPALTPSHPPSAQFDTPSPEPPSSTPTTPNDVSGPSSIEPSIVPNRVPPIREHSSVSANAPIYYDYSEQFEEVEQVDKQITQIYPETNAAPISMGFVQRIKTLLEDRGATTTPALHTPTVNFLQLPANDVHELPGSPIIKRITRDLILANLQPAESDDPQSQTTSQSQTHHTTNRSQTNNIDLRTAELREAPQSTIAAPCDQSESLPQGHEKQESTASEVVSYRSSTTTATAAIDYALHYSMPMSTMSLESELNVFIPDEQTDEDSTPASEEPNEPVTIVTAEVEVAAPTPTQSHWSPRFQKPIDLSRAQSTYVPNSIYSGGPTDLNTRFSTPTTRSDWPPSEESDASAQRDSDCVKLPFSSMHLSRVAKVELLRSPSPTPCIEVEQPPQEIRMEESPVSRLSERDALLLPLQNLSPVSPLSPLDRDSTRRDSSTTTHLTSIWSQRKPIPKISESPTSTSTRTGIRDSDCVMEQNQDNNSTTDLRFSALRPMTRPLDDVKEEPALEHSSVDLRASIFKFPLPQRKSSLAHFEEFRLSRDSRRITSGDWSREFAFRHRSRALSEQGTSRDPTFRPPSGALSLADIRAIPSLNFSRVDLFSKLNEELSLRRTASSEDVPELFVPAAQRPISSGIMREKYRSFFQSLEEMTNQNISQINIAPKGGEVDEAIEDRSTIVVSPIIRPFSPDELIAELDRISIPSINGLTQRLSELLPSLRRYYGEGGEPLDEEETIRSALDEIRRLGSHAPSFVTEDGFSDSETASTERAKSTVDLSIVAEESTAGSTANMRGSRPRSASSPGNNTVTPIAELEAPSPAVIRSRSLSDSQAAGTAFVSMERVVHTSARSLRSSPVESRPWNLDASYPWANGVQNIDISLPAPVLRRDIIRPKPSRLRLRDDASDTDDLGTELGSIVTAATPEPGDTTGATADTMGFSTTRRKISKRSIIGSISRKIGLKTSIDHSGFAIGPDILRGEDRAVDPGDRYPTTGLSPPSALIIDEVRSFFSDDSDHGDTAAPGVSFRKRLTNFKTRLPPISRAHSAMEHRTASHGHKIHRSNSMFVPNDGTKSIAGSTAVAYGDGVGMPKTEFRAKKLVERMKTLWYKGGELLRTLSGKKKPARPDHEWDDSGESAHWSNV